MSYPDATLETRLLVKSLDVERRTFRGMATTPDLDRQGHHVDPLGATFRNPLTLLWRHDQDQPIGTVTFFPATAAGIAFEASLPMIDTPGPLKDQIDRVWQLIKHEIVTGVSIGFRVLEDGVERLKSGALRLRKTEIIELSIVPIGANPHALIQIINKSLAASGRHASGVTDPIPVLARQTRSGMTIQEQITASEAKRSAQAAAMLNLMQGAADKGETLDTDQSDRYDALALEVKGLDTHLVRLHELETLNVQKAAPVVPAAGFRSVVPHISITPNTPPGTAFVRASMALLRAKGNRYEAAEIARQQWKDMPEVELYLKAAIAPGNTTDATWAGPLAVMSNVSGEFIGLLRPATILGKIAGLRKVPFNTAIPVQNSGGLYKWVGQGAPKPVGKLSFMTVSIGVAKAAGIIVITEELARVSNPDAEQIVRRDMIAGIAAFLDQQFIDPAVAAVAGVSPASITNTATPIATAGSALKDVAAIIGFFSTNNIPLGGVTLIMSETNAFALGMVRDTGGNRMFPNLGAKGGDIDGIQVVTSNVAGTNVVGLQPEFVLYADDGGVTIDVSREASVQMDSAPMGVPDATVVMTSLWQENLIGLRAERFINWQKGLSNAVTYVTGATYVPAAAMAESAPPPTRNGKAS